MNERTDVFSRLARELGDLRDEVLEFGFRYRQAQDVERALLDVDLIRNRLREIEEGATY